MKGLAAADLAEVVAVADVNVDAAMKAASAIPGTRACSDLDELLSMDLDGVVIATPNALHAGQAIAALDAGAAVFCQKPLGRTAAEVRRILEAAKHADRLLGVDFSYRYTHGLQKIASIIRSRAIGDIYAAELTFHNAYGPDKPWFYDRAQSGGGCVIDLGVHLIDMVLWMFDRPVVGGTARLFSKGVPWDGTDGVEDFGTIRLDFEGGATAQLSCSWRLAAGRDAIIEAAFYGPYGAVKWRNVGGSFFDFVAERFDGTQATVISEPPDEWGPRALMHWAECLGTAARYNPEIERALDVAVVLDDVYASTSVPGHVAARRAG
jgi:predicted dehydrogenase